MDEEYEVVISGVGGKFPEADHIDELKEKLMNKENLMTVDERRWQSGLNGTPPALGKVRDVEKFDYTFFGIHRRLSNFMDPQNRHILERSYEAIMDSGYNPNSLKGANIGVFMAAGLNETEYILITQKIHDGFGIVGLSRAMLPNRVSYFFNFKGPSHLILSSWDSGLEVLTYATNQIKKGHIDGALVGVSNLHMFSQTARNYANLDWLTFDESMKPFDADANGYVLSEAIVILFLQRKQDARRIYATVVHSDRSVHGERSTPFTVCPEKPIVSFLKDFYKHCQIDPKTVSFVEADGCAIKERDLTELKSLSQVLGEDKEGGLLVGSVKSNLGHTQIAANIVSVVKALIALETGVIPSNIMFKKPLSQQPAKIKIVADHTPLKGNLVAVNALSFGGGFGHTLLKQNSKKKDDMAAKYDCIPRLILMSARNLAGAETVINKVSSMTLDYEFVSLVNDIHQFDVPGHLYHTYVVHPGNSGKPVFEYAELQSEKAPIWFVFSGMGSQWPGMGRDLLKIKVFADSVAKCDKVLAPRGVDIYDVLTNDDPKVFDNILNCFVGIACVQAALVDLLYAIGIKPDGIIGHSLGELGCAYADGTFTAEQMVLSAYARGKASLETELIRGAMAAVGIGYKKIKDKLPFGVEVACRNSSESCTISGPENDVKNFVNKLTEEGIFVRLVKSANLSYHSQYIAPAGPKLLAYLKEVIPHPKPRSPRWISSSVLHHEWNTPLAQFSSPEYHTNNLLSPVFFEEACKNIPSKAICIEIAPHGLLQAIVRRSLTNCIHIPLTLRSSSCAISFLLSAIGKLYLNNVYANVNELFPKVEYPVSRETPSIASFVTWDHSENWTYGEKNRTIYASNEKKIDFNLQHKKYREISNYKIQKCVTVPTFVLLNFVWKKLMKMQGLKILETPVVFEDVWIHEVLTISEFSSLSLCVTVQQASGQFEVSLVDQDGCSAKSLMSGNCTALTTNDLSSQSVVIPSRSILESSYLHISQSDLYDIFNTYGYSFTDTFKNVNEIYVGDNDIIGKIEWTGNWVAFLEGLTQVIMYSKLDTTLEQSLYIPVHIQRLQIDPKEFISDTESEEVSVCLKPELNLIYCEGVQLEGLTLKVLGIDKPLSELYIESPVFVSHGTTRFKNPNDFIAACIQVVHANKFGCGVWMHGHNLTQYPAVLLEDSQHQFIYKRELQNNIESISGSELTNDDIEICLLVTSANTVYQPVTFRKPIANCEFYLIQSVSYFNPGHKIFNNFMVIFQQRFNNTCLTLLKQKQIKHVEYIHGTGLNKSELLSLIKVSINKINNSDEIGVIFNNMSIMSSYTTLQTIRKEQNNSQIKSIFVLGGEPSSSFPLSLQQCEDELMKGLSVNFFKNGQWGSIIMTNSIENKTKENLPIPQNCNKQIEFKFFSLNPNHFNYGSSLKTNPSLGPLEFSGLLNSKEKVMGFASWDITQVRTTLEIDDDFVWKVPELWTLEDAATVPFSFSLAIFSLKLLMKLKPNESILVHSGFSTLSQAVISVALQIGSTVFTTVNTERQKQELISLFPELNGDRILQLENDWFEAQILSLTRGNCVHVIFSTLAGDSFQASLKCLATNGRFMQLNKADMELGYKIGMSVFERNTSLFGYDTDNLFLIPNEWKKTIHEEVKKGIEMGYIKPLFKQTFQLSSQFSEAVTHVLNKDGEAKVVLSVEDNDASGNISNNCDSKSYIIVGSGSGLWLDVLEVLARNGARNLITVIDQTSVTGSQSRKINKLISAFNVTIQTLSVHQLNTIQSTEKFFNNLLLPFGQIDSIFIMLKDSDQHCIHNLDVVTRRCVPDIKFVCLMGAGERVCESRRNSGLHATAIISSSQTIHPRSVIPLLRSICLESTQNELVLLSQLSTNKDNDYEICTKLLETYLPVGVPELKLLSSSLQDKYCFTEVRSLSPYMNDLPNATPIFVIPGLNLSNMTPLILQLMAPVFCAQLPSDLGSAKETAKHLLAPLLEIQPKGPYNIIGETWSGGVALELARLLEESGNKVLVTLLSGTPHTVQHLVKSLGSYDSYNFNKNLLSMALQLPVEVFDKANESVNGEPAWDESVSQILENLNENCGDTELFISLSAIHSRVKSLMDYEIFPLKQSSIALLHANNSFIGSNLHKLYGDNVIVHLMENCDHYSMLSSVKTADLINELINFTF